VHGLRDGGIVAENSAPGNPTLAPQAGNVSPDDPSEQLAIFTLTSSITCPHIEARHACMPSQRQGRVQAECLTERS
jgi:hypothetical protein